jgi:hypothetical protein
MRSADTPTDSHAKNAKGAKNCNDENNRFWTLVSVGLLGDLGDLCVMRGPSHAKSAKGAKDCGVPVAS